MGKNRIGFSMLLWTPVLRDEHVRHFARLAELGYDGVEIPLVGTEPGVLRSARRELERLGLRSTAVGFATAEADPIDADPAVRRAATEHLALLCERAALLGAEIVAGPIHSAYARFRGRGPTADERRRCAEVLHAAGAAAARAGVRLGVEPLNRFECYLATTAAEADALVRAADHPALCTVYDTHHAHIEEADPAAAIASCRHTLGHVQVSESHRGVPGAGQVRWEQTFAALAEIGYERWLVVESFSRADPEWGGMLHVWRDVAPSPEAVCAEGLRFVRARLGG
jgi:D-psicose/D-tagatose/L-ribulose 3-epimerase